MASLAKSSMKSPEKFSKRPVTEGDRQNRKLAHARVDSTYSSLAAKPPLTNESISAYQLRIHKLFDQVRRPTEAELRRMDRICTKNMIANLNKVEF
jgi:hypothetical protein